MSPLLAERITFAPFADFLERLSRASSVPRKTTILKKYYASFCEFQAQFCTSNAIDTSRATAASTSNPSTSDCVSFFPVLRLLAPMLDNERPACGIQPKTMGRLVIRVLAIDARSADAQLLLRRDEGTSAVAAVATDNSGNSKQGPREDYADVVYGVMRRRASATNAKCAFTVAAVNEKLDRIAAMYQENRRECEFCKRFHSN